MEHTTAIELRHITKRFGKVVANDDISLEIRRGEILSLLGENGSGKTTLMNMISGIYFPDEGHIFVEGKEVTIRSPKDAYALGIGMIHQHFKLVDVFTAAENIVLGLEGKGRFDIRSAGRRVKEISEKYGFDIDPDKKVYDMSVSEKQTVEIIKVLYRGADILILDEPTSSLDDREVEKLFTMMRRLKEKGVGIIFVTHFLEQVYAVCDGITVLRNGKLVGEYDIADLPRVKLVAAMMGKDFDDLASIKPETTGDKRKEPMVIEARGLSHAGTIKPFDLDIHKGEVIGLTGLLGSGRSELARAIYGADRAQTGTLKVKGQEVKVKNPIDAMHLGMGLLPDDRKAEGIIADLSVRENIILAVQAKQGILKKIPMAKQCEIADKYIDLLQIKCASRETLIKQLSGGNQQKVILARWLATNPDFLILDEPTRGIDIGTKTEIQKLVLKLADEGKSLIFISSEIEEMLRTCNRMAVLRDGQKVGEIDEQDMNQMNVMKAIAGGDK